MTTREYRRVTGIKALWERIGAALYETFLAKGEEQGMGERRRAVLARARGRVLEIGAGTGLNIDHYPPGLERLVLTEPIAPMAERLRHRAEHRADVEVEDTLCEIARASEGPGADQAVSSAAIVPPSS